MLNFGKTLAQFDQFLWGAGVTIVVSLLGALFGMVVGLTLVFLRDAKWRPVRWIAHLYISFVRGTPLLVQIFLVYYALPGLTGIDLAPFTAGVLALSLNSGAFASEIFRAGLSQIPPGQYEAADSLGLPRFITWPKIILAAGHPHRPAAARQRIHAAGESLDAAVGHYRRRPDAHCAEHHEHHLSPGRSLPDGGAPSISSSSSR